MIDVEALLKTDAYKNVSDEQKKLLREMLPKLEGKTGMDALPVLMEYSKKAPKGVKYSKAEENAMLNAFLDAMPAEEKGAFQKIISFFEKMTREKS